MQPKRIKYYLLGLFIFGMVLFIVLQFNSTNNIHKLIKGNEQLLQELNAKNELQKLQTNLAKTDIKVRGAVISQDTNHIIGIEAEVAIIKSDLKEINRILKTDSTEKLLTQLNYLVDEKNAFNLTVLDTFYNNGKRAAERIINNQKGKRLAEAITNIVHQLDSTHQAAVNKATHIIDSSGQKAQRWGTVLVFFACLTSLLAFLYILSRIHKQEQLIEALDKSQRTEKKLGAIKEQFLANMSHEIRTPMNAVLGFTHLLKNQPLNEQSKEYVGAIETAGQNLLEIINDILDLSKIESGMMRIEPVSFSIRSVLHGVNTLFKPKAAEKQLQLSVSADDNVPDILYGDPIRLTQVLVNLTSNAIKFTDRGKVDLSVKKVWSDDHSIRLLLTVSDTGIGIDPSKQQSIFDRFNQAEAATTRKFGGTGLGLTIVKQLVELQHGSISVESVPGEGAAFKVELPYALGESLSEGPDTYLSEGDILPVHPDVRILVAEDNKMNQNLLKHLLNNWQLQYKLVNNGAEVLQALDRQHFDLVLLDIQMPEMDGYTVIQVIRNELKSTIPVIAMTAHAMTGEREKCLQLGMNEYLAKPINEEELYKLIQLYTGKLPSREHSNFNSENNTASLINMQYLEQLSNGNEAFIKTMLEQFITQLPEELTQLKKAIADDNISAIRATAHTLKTTVAFIGLESSLYPLLNPLESLEENHYHAQLVATQFNKLKQLSIQAVQEAIHILL